MFNFKEMITVWKVFWAPKWITHQRVPLRVLHKLSTWSTHKQLINSLKRLKYSKILLLLAASRLLYDVNSSYFQYINVLICTFTPCNELSCTWYFLGIMQGFVFLSNIFSNVYVGTMATPCGLYACIMHQSVPLCVLFK